MRKGLTQAVLMAVAAAILCAADNPTKVRIAAVQFRSSFDIKENSGRIAAHLKQLAKDGVQVAVFPECALTGYSTGKEFDPSAAEVEAAEQRIAKTCREVKIAAVVGSVFKVNSHVYDTAVVFDRRGELVERYGKVYLAGEKWATPGNHVAFFDLDGIPSTVIVCHDERYPELVRLPAIGGARIVYYISAESGMRQESKLAPYRAQVMARAVENGVFVVQANAPANFDLSGSHGQSRIVAADGNVLKEASYFGEDVVVGDLDLAPHELRRPLEGALADWWKAGVDAMMNNRRRPLD